MSLNVSEALFADLRAQKQGNELQQLNITVGDYSEQSHMGPLYIPDWAEGRARVFVCDTAGAKGDGKAPLCLILGNRAPSPRLFDDENGDMAVGSLQGSENLDL